MYHTYKREVQMHVFRYLIELTLHFKRKYLEKTPTVNGSY